MSVTIGSIAKPLSCLPKEQGRAQKWILRWKRVMPLQNATACRKQAWLHRHSMHCASLNENPGYLPGFFFGFDFFTFSFSFSGLWGVFIAPSSAVSKRAVASFSPYESFGSFVMRKTINVVTDECVFCGARGKLTEEHAFADWLEPYVPFVGRSSHTTSRAVSKLPALSAEDYVETWRKGLLHKRKKLKIVCARCNNEWMSRLQTQAQPVLLPMLQGRWPETISAWDRRGLAAWATMFTMVAEFADPHTQTIDFASRERLRLNVSPPDGWYVWIGLTRCVLWRLGFNHFAWGKPIVVWPAPGQSSKEALAAAALTPPKKHMQSTGFVVGPVFIQTMSSSEPGLKVDAAAFAKRHGLRVVWPSDNLAIERPVNVLDDIAADKASAGLLPPYYPRNNIRRAWESWVK